MCSPPPSDQQYVNSEVTMIEYVRATLISQYEAALSMLNQCVAACPAEHWDAKIGNGPFRWVVYHTLFFTDLYLTTSNEEFELRDLHRRVGDEREDRACLGLEHVEALEYATVCRAKIPVTLSIETPELLAGPSGFSWYPISRGELHLVNIRHIQHHAGQLSAFLRKVNANLVHCHSLILGLPRWKQPCFHLQD
jgi:hypothetical protein